MSLTPYGRLSRHDSLEPCGGHSVVVDEEALFLGLLGPLAQRDPNPKYRIAPALCR